MRMTCASFMQFYENVDMSILWSICHRGGNERGATATTTEMVPRQHSDDPTTHQDVGANKSVDLRKIHIIKKKKNIQGSQSCRHQMCVNEKTEICKSKNPTVWVLNLHQPAREETNLIYLWLGCEYPSKGVEILSTCSGLELVSVQIDPCI